MTHDRCTRCGSDLVETRGAGRTAMFEGIAVAVPTEMVLVRCPGCMTIYPTATQASELRDAMERDFMGDGGRGHRPPLRGT